MIKSANHTISDFELWELFRNGSSIAFELIYKTYFDRLYNYGCQFVHDTTLVEDVIQELFVELQRRSFYLSSTDTILPYLYSAFRRKMIRAREKSKRYEELDLSVVSFPLELSVEEEIILHENDASKSKLLNETLKKLSEKHREIIFLYFYENMSYEEIKEIQGFENVKSARNLLYKALDSMRGIISRLSVFILFKLFQYIFFDVILRNPALSKYLLN